jgi:polysaccharide export outer membrane protein
VGGVFGDSVVSKGMVERTALDGLPRGLWPLAMLLLAFLAGGCEVNSFFDPSKTGYFGTTPITMPVLDRIAAIEPSTDLWGETSQVSAADLVPSNISYRLHPGDVIDVQIYELYTPGQFYPVTTRIDQGGLIHIPDVGPVTAAGLTVPQLQQEVIARLAKEVMKNPTVQVNVVEGGALAYVLYGHINQPGRFTLQDPTLRLLDALAMAGGVPLSTRRVYVVRQVAINAAMRPQWDQGSEAAKTSPKKSPPVDLESLINQLQDDGKNPAATPAPPSPSPGAWSKAGDPPIDVEDVSPANIKLPSVQGGAGEAEGFSSPFLYLPDKKQWVRSQPAAQGDAMSKTGDAAQSAALLVERVIEVPYQRLAHGDTSLNLIVRAGDQIYVDGPPTGYVYISGEINAPNAYPLAIPDRVDLVRQVDEGREATIRLNLGAIRRRTEPDVIMKPNDHVLVGTNWFAYPLAIFRNGLRMNYGFGFLLDRNFGNDVFGAPPTNIGN